MTQVNLTESCLLNRQSSAIMYPYLDRPKSTISFVTHTTKQIQTDLMPYKEPLKKAFKKPTVSKSIAIDTHHIENP